MEHERQARGISCLTPTQRYCPTCSISLQDQARKILKNNIAEFNKVMQTQDVIRENEQKVFGLTNGTIEDVYFKTSEQARELAKLALDEAQRVYKTDKDKHVAYAERGI